MSYIGRQFKGAAKVHRANKRDEAIARNAATRPERRRAARRPCPTGKLRYATEQTARAELVGTVMSRNRGKEQRHECRIYECPMCGGGWHLTSSPERRPANA